MKRYCLFFLVFLFSLPLIAADTKAVAVLLDISRSVPPGDFQQAKQTIREMAEQTKAPDSLSIYVFGNTMKRIGLAELQDIQANESYTMVYDAAYDVALDLAKLDADRKAILIISDGEDTKSVTVLEDIVAFTNEKGIAVYGGGVGKVNRKVLERMAKLTGGKFFALSDPEFSSQFDQAVAGQRKFSAKETLAAPAVQTPAPVVQPRQQPSPQPVSEEAEAKTPFLWILGIGALGIAALGAIAFLIVRSTREVRTCPTCGKKLESYQTICPDCSSVAATAQTSLPQKKAAAPTDGTQELKVSEVGDEDLVPIEWLEKKPVTEEMLSKTFVLMETPMLVVRKGKNLGQTYSLNRAFPVSIGRSRVNEIRLDDIATSAQHCRIIPENGKHVLYDLGSTNGTFVNDAKVNKAILKEGDTLKIGETQFLYKIEQFRN